MELYHGSSQIVSQPTLEGGRPDNDYGRGFYCTERLELAMEWACKDDTRDAFVCKYDLPTEGLNIVDLDSGKYHILNWLAILLANRRLGRHDGAVSAEMDYILTEFLPDLSAYDVIKGYRVDDSYFSIARAFMNNTISLEALGKALKLGNLGSQVCLKTQKAFDALSFLAYVPVPYEEYYPRKVSRDRTARAAFFGRDDSADGIFMIDIFREKWHNDDPRLF